MGCTLWCLDLKIGKTPLYPMVLLIIIPMKNGYFIGNILGGELPTNRKWVSSPQFFEWINPTKIPFITGVGKCPFLGICFTSPSNICWKLYPQHLGDVQLGHLPTPEELQLNGGETVKPKSWYL